jgi:hypothetical protein
LSERSTISAPSTIIQGAESPIGEPLATLPPRVPVLRIGCEAKRCHSSCSESFGYSSSTAL